MSWFAGKSYYSGYVHGMIVVGGKIAKQKEVIYLHNMIGPKPVEVLGQRLVQ